MLLPAMQVWADVGLHLRGWCAERAGSLMSCLLARGKCQMATSSSYQKRSITLKPQSSRCAFGPDLRRSRTGRASSWRPCRRTLSRLCALILLASSS